jgi:Tol biopolymer transport system component
LFNPIISRDGKRLFAFGVDEHGELMRYDTKRHTFDLYLGGLSAICVTFSRDGQSVAYVTQPEVDLWRARSDGTLPRRLTYGSLLGIDGVTWSPDGNSIAFRARTPNGPMRIFLIPSAGGTEQELLASQAEQGLPTWSADGTRLAFGDVPKTHGIQAGGEVVHLYDLRQHQLATLPGSNGLWSPRRSPDGRYIAANDRGPATQAARSGNRALALDGRRSH